MSKGFWLEGGAVPFPGHRLNRFLGRGGFGEVWEAQAPDGGMIAIKFLPCADRSKAAQEIRSIEAVRQLRHPNLVQIENVWCCPQYLAVAMEMADGSLQDLYEIYQAELGTPIPTEHLGSLLGQAAAALDFLNARQHSLDGRLVALRHRDVKPTNLLVVGEAVKVSDFSLTTVAASEEMSHGRAGTPAYAAPEVFQGRLSDRTDQYALAVTYCQLRGGRLPFADTPASFSRNYVRPAPDLTMLPPTERPVIARALAPVPLDRWPSCGAMIAQLQGRTEPSLSQSPQDRRSAKRDSCRLRVWWRPLGEEERRGEKATIRNISRRGIGLINGSRFPRGTILVVELIDGAEKFNRPVYIRVVHAIPRPEGDWLLGCTFARPLGEGELQTLLSLSGKARSESGLQVSLLKK